MAIAATHRPYNRVLTLDAGLLQSSTTRAITQRGGDYLGVVKQNFREVKAAIDSWWMVYCFRSS